MEQDAKIKSVGLSHHFPLRILQTVGGTSRRSTAVQSESPPLAFHWSDDCGSEWLGPSLVSFSLAGTFIIFIVIIVTFYFHSVTLLSC